MKAFKDKVAVVTGASSGIGHTIAERCIQEGVKIVLADIEEERRPMSKTSLRIKAPGKSFEKVL